mgnify:FL=1
MNALPLIGRILFSMIFIMSGLNHFMKLDMMTGMASQAGVPVPGASVIISGIILVLGGLSVLLGYQAKIGAVLLFIFLILASFMVHDFWNYPEDQTMQQMISFMKNLSMAGGTLIIYYFGSGPMSLSDDDE